MKGGQYEVFCTKIPSPSKGQTQLGYRQIFWCVSHCKYLKRDSIHWSASDNTIKGEEIRELKVKRMPP